MCLKIARPIGSVSWLPLFKHFSERPKTLHCQAAGVWFIQSMLRLHMNQLEKDSKEIEGLKVRPASCVRAPCVRAPFAKGEGDLGRFDRRCSSDLILIEF